MKVIQSLTLVTMLLASATALATPTVFPVVITAPFQEARTTANDACSGQEGAPTCSEDATVAAASGEYVLAASISSAASRTPLEAGVASAWGSIRHTVPLSGTAPGQAFKVTVDGFLNDASVDASPATWDLDEYAQVHLWLYVGLTCAGCGTPGAHWFLVRTGNITAPTSVQGPFNYTMTVRAPAGRTATAITIEPRFFADGRLGNDRDQTVPTLPVARNAQASASLDVTSITVELAP